MRLFGIDLVKLFKTGSFSREPASSCSPRDLTPVKKPPAVVHPENAPRIIHDSGFPKDFADYEYAGATLEVLTTKDFSTGKSVRRPALVAKMVLRYRVNEGSALIEVEMMASIKDLRRGTHPNAAAIAAALTSYYTEKVANREPISPTQKNAFVTTASKYPINDFLSKKSLPIVRLS